MSILIYIGLCILVAYYAGHRGRSAVGWFLAALIISPILSAIVLAVMRDLTVDRDIRRNSMETDRIKERMSVSEANMKYRMDNMERRIDRVDGNPVIDSETHEMLGEGDPDWKYCPQCGTKVDLSASYCPKCGTKLQNEGEAAK